MSGVYIPHQILDLDQLFCPSVPLLVACSASVVVPLDHHHHHQDQHELEPPQHLRTVKHTHSLNPSLHHPSLAYSLTHSLTHSLTRSLARSLNHT